MEDLLDRVSVTLTEVASDSGLPRTDDEEECLVLQDQEGHRGRRGMGEKVKWLGVILVEDLDFSQH